MAVDKDYVRTLLKVLKFKLQNGANEIWKKQYKNHNNYVLKVDFDKEEIIYKDNSIMSGILVSNKATSNFAKDENFVVLECIDRLLEKGYKPECHELEHTLYEAYFLFLF